ncbi:MAG: M23 family metallopeptidase [Actinobacteria bacterium]|nr:M23 family metallopeptidase [Actinomycetota bacterium]MCB9389090.1 M23 family metallopeptidase [Acidimicrobiia bacterium]
MVISSRAARWGALLVSLICVFSLVFITGLRAAPLPGPTLESLENDVQSAVAEYLQAETDAATAQEELNALNTRLNEFLVDLSEFADQRLPQLADALGYVTEDDREQFGARWHKTISQYMLVIEQVTKDPVVASELEGFRETFVQMLSDYLGALAHSQDAQVRMESAALEATLILSSRYDIDAAQARDSLAHGTLDSLLTDLYAAQNPEEAAAAIDSIEGDVQVGSDQVRIENGVVYGLKQVKAPSGNTMVCPLPGGTFIRDYGAARSGGRTHQGTDIFNQQGTPNVAVMDGELVLRPNNLGGNAVWLIGDDGSAYYYAHFQTWVGEGRRVQQGEIIGLTGDTGNSPAGLYHTHFEVHPTGRNGDSINPFDLLTAACT